MKRTVRNLSIAIVHLVSLSSGIVVTQDDREQSSSADYVKVEDYFKDSNFSRQNRAETDSFANGTNETENEGTQNDPTMLFQRIICAADSIDGLKNVFNHELSWVPLSLFDEKGSMRKNAKSMLYKVFDNVKERHIKKTNAEFVVDGGDLIHRVEWPAQGTFAKVYAAYVAYIRRYYGQRCTIVFDGYSRNANSTKGSERRRRQGGVPESPEIICHNTSLAPEKLQFLNNPKNKMCLISELASILGRNKIGTVIATDDADLSIVHTSIEKSRLNKKVFIVGVDIDLLVLAIALSPLHKDIKFLKRTQGISPTRTYSCLLYTSRCV